MSLFAGVEIPGHPDLENIRKLDLLPIPMIRRCQRVGMAIDIDYLNDLSADFGAQMVELEKDIASYIPPERLADFGAKCDRVETPVDEDGNEIETDSPTVPEFNAGSAEQICTLLFEILDIGSGVDKLKYTKDGRISTGKKQLELLRKKHPIVKKVLDWREVSKLRTTYTLKLPRIAKFHPRAVESNTCPVCEHHHETESWRVHGEIGTTRAETGRLNHKNPNNANIPTRSDNGGMVRAGYIAPPGKLLVSRDLSQIELRDLAHCANAASMIKVYQERRDIHISTACAANDLDESMYTDFIKRDKKKQLNPAEKDMLDYFKLHYRLPAKNLNFMIVYGATVIGLLAQLALSGLFWTEEEGLAFIDRWFNLYPEVHAYMDLQQYRARRYGMVWDLFGRVRLIPEVKSSLKWIKSAGLRQGGNMPIQSIAAGQMKLAMGRANQMLSELRDMTGAWIEPLTSIHDQLMIEADEEVAEDVQDVLSVAFDQCMDDMDTGAHRFRVPILSDGETVSRWVKD